MIAYDVHFDRIGRSYRDRTERFVARDADDLAEQIFRFARRHLTSRDFQVLVDLKTGRVTIDAGRFGTGTVLGSEEAVT